MGEIKNSVNRRTGVPLPKTTTPDPAPQAAKAPAIKPPAPQSATDKLGLVVGGDFSLDLPPFDPSELVKADGVDATHTKLVRSIDHLNKNIEIAKPDLATIAQVPEERQQLASEIDALKVLIENLESESKDLRAEITHSETRVKSLESQNAQLAKENQALAAQIQQTDAQLQQLADKRKTLQESMIHGWACYSQLSNVPQAQRTSQQHSLVIRYEAAEQQVAALTQEIEKLSIQGASFSISMQHNDQQIQRNNLELKGLQTDLSQAKTEMASNQQVLNNSLAQLKALEGQLQAMNSHGSRSDYDAAFTQLTHAMSAQQPTTLGPYPVGTGYATLQDPGRPDRGEIPVRVQYPEGEGPFPTLIVSHGVGGSMDAYTNLGNFLASQGYVVIHPTHHDKVAGQELAKQGYSQKEMIPMLLGDPQELSYRPQDLSFLIDSLENGTLAEQIPAIDGKADASEVGLIGHSFGGYAVMAAAGATVDLPNAPDTSFKDSRVKTVIALDPARLQSGIDAGASAEIDIPTAVMYSTKLEERGGYFDEMPAGGKYDFLVKGAEHEDYGDKGDPRFQAATMATSLAMFDAYLKGQPQSAAWLQAGGLSKTQPSMLDFDQK